MYIHTGSLARPMAFFGMGNGPIFLANLYCDGTESTLFECNRNVYGSLSCSHFEDAGITCQGKSCINNNYACIDEDCGIGIARHSVDRINPE